MADAISEVLTKMLPVDVTGDSLYLCYKFPNIHTTFQLTWKGMCGNCSKLIIKPQEWHNDLNKIVYVLFLLHLNKFLYFALVQCFTAAVFWQSSFFLVKRYTCNLSSEIKC